VFAKVRERLAVSKQTANKCDGERLNDVTKQYQIEISDMLTCLDNLSNSRDINRAWKNNEPQIKRIQVCVK